MSSGPGPSTSTAGNASSAGAAAASVVESIPTAAEPNVLTNNQNWSPACEDMSRLKYASTSGPVPPGVSVKYWSNLYNREDSRGKKLKGKARTIARETGDTRVGALAELVKEINNCDTPEAHAQKDTHPKWAVIRKTRKNLPDAFFDLMTSEGFVFPGYENWRNQGN